MGDWFGVTGNEELHEGQAVRIKAKSTDIVLVKSEGNVFALKNLCPHLGCTMHRGKIKGNRITCPCHDWVFDIRTGEFIAAPEIKIPVYPVKVEDGQIMVNIQEGSL